MGVSNGNFLHENEFMKLTLIKQILLCTLLILMGTACSSDDIPDVPFTDNANNTTKYTMTIPLKSDSTLFNKVDHNSRVPSLNKVYLYVDYENNRSFTPLEFPVTVSSSQNNGELNGSINMTIYRTSDGKIMISDGNRSVDVSGFVHCMLTSSNTLNVELDTGSPTPGGKIVYNACGDKLFRTHGFHFYYGNEHVKWGTGIFAYDHYSIKFHDDGLIFAATRESMNTNKLDFDKLCFEFDRYTANVEANLYMVHWEKPHKHALHEELVNLDESFFNRRLPGTTLGQWSVRMLLGNAPDKFNFFDHALPKPAPTGTSLVNLCNSVPVSVVDVEYRLAVGWDKIPDWLPSLVSIKGIGSEMTGRTQSFVLPMTNSNSKIYYLFHCSDLTDELKSRFYEYRTLRIDFSELGINAFAPNGNYEIMVVIQFIDFQRAMDKYISRQSRNSHIVQDPIFGEVVDIPYKVVVRKIEDKNTKKN